MWRISYIFARSSDSYYLHHTCSVGGVLRYSNPRGQGKNVEILHAVEDLIKIIRAHPLYDHLEMVSEEEVTKLKKHYNHFMYQVINRSVLYSTHRVD